MVSATGQHTELWYRYEETADSPPAPDFSAGTGTEDGDRIPFGPNATLSQFEGSNNAVELFEPNSRRIAEIIEQQFEGTVAIDFELRNTDWLKAVLGQENVSGGTYSFDPGVPFPLVLYVGYEQRALEGSDSPGYRVLSGVVIQSATIDVSVDDTASVSLSGAYAREEWDTSGLQGQPPLTAAQYDAGDVMTFSEARLDLNGDTLALVQDASLEINNNTDLIREIGTRFAVDYSPKGQVPSVDYTKIKEGNTEMEQMYGSQAATATKQRVDSNYPLTFVFDNGKSGADIFTLTFNGTGAFPDSLGVENIGNPQEDLQQSINRRLEKINATVEFDGSI